MKIIGVILLGTLVASCGTQEKQSADESNKDTVTVATVEVESNPHDLILIDGVKWGIDEGMRGSIDSIELRMQSFTGLTLEDYEALSVDLARHTKAVISNCTMKGQAHDELHKWLLPFIDLRKELNGITEVAEGDLIAEELNNELVIFNTYFK